jgi:hypothetical protein
MLSEDLPVGTPVKIIERFPPILIAFAACLLTALSGAAHAAQSYPTKPLRFIVPFPPGGGTDILARLVGEKLGERFGHQAVVDNRPGAGTNIGMEIAARAAPDGHTLIMASVGLAANPRPLPEDDVQSGARSRAGYAGRDSPPRYSSAIRKSRRKPRRNSCAS